MTPDTPGAAPATVTTCRIWMTGMGTASCSNDGLHSTLDRRGRSHQRGTSRGSGELHRRTPFWPMPLTGRNSGSAGVATPGSGDRHRRVAPLSADRLGDLREDAVPEPDACPERDRDRLLALGPP